MMTMMRLDETDETTDAAATTYTTADDLDDEQTVGTLPWNCQGRTARHLEPESLCLPGTQGLKRPKDP